MKQTCCVCANNDRCQTCSARFSWTQLTLHDMTTSVLPKHITPLVLAVVRSILVAYYFAVLIVQWSAWDQDDDTTSMRYFTNQTFLYLFLTMATICAFSWSRQPWRAKLVDPAIPQWYVVLVWVVWETLLTSALFLDIVYWALLAPRDMSGATFMNINVHAIQAVLAAIDFVLNRISFQPSHIAFAIIYPTVYMIFAWIWYADRMEWIYDFVNLMRDGGTVALTYLGIAALFTVIFFLFWFLDWLKRKLFRYGLNDAHRDIVFRGGCLFEETFGDGDALQVKASVGATREESDSDSFHSANSTD